MPLATARLKKQLSFHRHIDTFSRSAVICDTKTASQSMANETRYEKRSWTSCLGTMGRGCFPANRDFRASSSRVEFGKANAPSLPL